MFIRLSLSFGKVFSQINTSRAGFIHCIRFLLLQESSEAKLAYNYTAERIASRWTDGLIVINSDDFENAQKLGFKAGENLFYVHGVGLDLSEYANPSVCENNIRASLGIGQEDIIVTCVAELNKNKNHDFLLDAWCELTRRHNYINLLFVGTGEEMATLQKRVLQEHL